MSVIVAVRKGRRIVMAADTLSACGPHREDPANTVVQKIRRVGGALLGIAGWSIYDNILLEQLAAGRPPRLTDRTSIFRFFLRLWKNLQQSYNFVNEQCREKDSPFGDVDAQFVVANRRGIFGVASNLSVGEYRQYHAIGSGADYAHGALFTLYAELDDPREIALRAVRAAIHFDLYCGGEIDCFEVSVG